MKNSLLDLHYPNEITKKLKRFLERITYKDLFGW